MIGVLFTIFIFFAVWTGSLIVFRAIAKNRIPAWQFLFFAVSVTGIITHVLNVW